MDWKISHNSKQMFVTSEISWGLSEMAYSKIWLVKDLKITCLIMLIQKSLSLMEF